MCPLPMLRISILRLSGMQIGQGTFINMGLRIIDDYQNMVSFGERVAVAPHATFVAVSHPNHSSLRSSPKYSKSGTIYVGDDSWIGPGAVIMPEVTIGIACIIAANSVVTKSVNDHEIIGGVPAKSIGRTDT